MATRVTSVVCFCLFRLLLPLTLLAAAAFRYNALSFMYLVCLLITPLLPYPMVRSMAGHTGRFLKAMIVLSALPVLAHIIFHITLVAIATDDEPYGSIFPNCSQDEMIARQFGFQRLDNVPYYHAIRLILPDVGVLAVSIVVFVVSTVLLRRDNQEDNDLPITSSYVRRRQKMASIFNYVGEFFVGLLLAASGIMVPSLLSSVYFLVFLALCVLWACYQSLGRRYAMFRMVLLSYTGAHILLLHLYQFQFFQEALPKDRLIARLLGLTGVIQTDCDAVYKVEFYSDVRWMQFVNPGVLLLLYWLLAFETRYWFKTKDLTAEEIMSGQLTSHKRKRKRTTNAERQRLVDEDGENVNYNSMAGQEGASGASGAGREPQAGTSSQIEEGPEDRGQSGGTSAVSKRAPLVSIFMFAMKQSYVLMLIVMMAWSIMYLSWLTFVLLLVACLLWMLPNSRRASLVSSPVLVLYVLALVMAQYAFNMNLASELPTKAGDMPIKEIGLFRFDTPVKDLAFHLFFTMFFMMSLRQFMRERRPATEQPTGLQMSSRGDETPIEGLTDLMSKAAAADVVIAWSVAVVFVRRACVPCCVVVSLSLS